MFQVEVVRFLRCCRADETTSFPIPAMYRFTLRFIAEAILGVGLASGCLADSSGDTVEPGQALSASPDGRFFLVRSCSEPGEHGEARKSVEIRKKGGLTLYRWTSPIGSVVPLWSPDGTMLAVNDSPGDRGDQLRVFRLEGSKIVPLREPDGDALRREVMKRHGNFLSMLREVSLPGWEWREGRLWCRVRGEQSPKRQPSLRVAFHDLWVYSFRSGNAVLEEVWNRSEPSERVVRSADSP